MSGRRLSHFLAKAMPTATRTALLEHQTGYSSPTRQQQTQMHPSIRRRFSTCLAGGPRNCFGEGDASGAAPALDKDKSSKLASIEVGSNPSSPITEPSIVGSSPSRLASVPGHHNQWPGNASVTVGMHSPSQPKEQVFDGATTHGQPYTARGAADEHSRPASNSGHHNQWPDSASIAVVGMHSPSQSSASDASGRNAAHGQHTAAYGITASASHASAQAPGHPTLWPASVTHSTGGGHNYPPAYHGWPSDPRT
jgi:hypothetical protein